MSELVLQAVKRHLNFQFPNHAFNFLELKDELLEIFFNPYANERQERKIRKHIDVYMKKYHPKVKYKVERMAF
jgi:hypothetical protein